ncbi:uncharacterized protein LOC143776201 isoform X2 [Ranitomeya variabilis]|uniref:uncharacterized protein LOC143776201 isoform X2 n=1 Tax=Ranitomeya variabilis TaxID=490064 RepID=UPI0040575285
MDFKAREASWQGQINAVFCGGDTGPNTDKGLQYNDIFNEIKNLTHKRTRSWWNRAFLDNYMQRQLIPRGLRIQVTPSFPVDDEEFVKNWEEICNGTSRKLMELLIKLNLGILTKIDDLLDETFTKAKAILTPEQIQTINVQMDKNIDQWVKDIQTKQSSKLMRDQKDFSGGNVYRWRRHHPKESLRDGTPSASSNLPLCDVSGTSSSVFSMVSTGSTPKRKREPRYVPAKKPYGYTNENSGNNLKRRSRRR